MPLNLHSLIFVDNYIYIYMYMYNINHIYIYIAFCVKGCAPAQQLEEPRAEGDRHAENDALADAVNVILHCERCGAARRPHLQAVHGGVEEDIVGLFEGRKHKDALVHLGNAESRDAQHFALQGQRRRVRPVVPLMSSSPRELRDGANR
jgi:hypothetical protein